MAKLCYVHWNREELEPRVRTLEAEGHQVLSHGSTGEHGEHLRLGDFVPEVVFSSLDRLPSHGQAVAEWAWEAKKRRSIPILFAGGAPDKVEATRSQFPGALFCATGEVPRRVASLFADGAQQEAAANPARKRV